MSSVRVLTPGLLAKCGGELQHYLSDVAAMKLTVWTDGGFGMCAHNYDGDVLTDELAQVHKSPGYTLDWIVWIVKIGFVSLFRTNISNVVTEFRYLRFW